MGAKDCCDGDTTWSFAVDNMTYGFTLENLNSFNYDCPYGSEYYRRNH